jgi:hypothetical protein
LSDGHLLEHSLSLVLSWVDGESHALSAVALLSAVKPWAALELWLIKQKMFNLQIGVATVTCIAIWGGGVTLLLMFGMNPESNPPARASQGVVKADCVAVWFCSKNVKMTISPMAASIVSGE